ncbi:hypothetical protein E2C01_045700 [Portunus trituberculatus]|uniref:Uncharacterized protein n=1 Tax=Portunus trituberculatus TaxID=210409 RepID=A0A5B7G233_PORTR|nr:hypothetical protein [Portunus trituberculatus]
MTRPTTSYKHTRTPPPHSPAAAQTVPIRSESCTHENEAKEKGDERSGHVCNVSAYFEKELDGLRLRETATMYPSDSLLLATRHSQPHSVSYLQLQRLPGWFSRPGGT